MTSHLKALAPGDLETLLQRRPEVRRLPRSRQDFGALAELLATPLSIHTAVASLNGFLIQLLQLALWLGPEATATELTTHAPGVPLEDLRAGAEELSRWGLAFIEHRGPSQPDAPVNWVLHVPACTVAAVAMPPGVGALARRLLDQRSMEFLVALARNVGLPSRPHSGKASMLGELSAALSEPDRVRALLGEASPQAIAMFERIRDAGGSMTRHEMMLGGIIRWSDPAWSERRKVLTPLDWLESRGLVILDANAVYTGAMVVPGEVELALRGGQLFRSWSSASPPELDVTDGGPHAAEAGDPAKIVAEMETLLEAWAQTRPPTLQRGGLGVRELRRTAKAVGFPERYVCFLYALAAEAGLIGVDDDGRVVPSPAGLAWPALPAPRRWALLFEAWLAGTLWTEEAEDGLVPLDQAQPALWVTKLRRGAVEELAGLAPGVSTDAAGIGARLAWRYPALLQPGAGASNFVRLAVQGLLWLGTASGPHPVRLLEPGRSAIADPGWWGTPGPGAAAFAPEVATCTVGADLTIIVPGPPVHELGSALGRFADLKASSPARIYQLSETSLRRALDDGMPATDIVAVLERHAPKGVPQNVAYLIEDVGRRHGNLVAGRAGLYLRSEDPALLRAAVADRRLASFQPRLIAPTVAVLESIDLAQLLSVLRAGGYLPVAEDGGGLIRGMPRPRRVHRLLVAPEHAGPLSAAEAGELAQAIRTGPKPDAPKAPAASRAKPRGGRRPGVTAHDRGDIRDLLQVAIAEGRVVEISYTAADGAETTREIEPLDIDGAFVDAWCRLREDERRFAIGGIGSARMTGERFYDDLPGFSPAARDGLGALDPREEDLDVDLR